ncbi:MAG TPA: FtsX-like permease family protein, partial [Vicinamibacterales bacterium]
FVFPLDHGYWIPWRIDASGYEPRSGPSVNVFGRLAPGATIESAQAELTAIGERMSAAQPGTHQHVRPRVLPYPHAYNDMDDPQNALTLQAMQVAIVLMLVVVSVNVAILVYARTATRQGEIVVRGALGASRRRIVTQLFVEALLLAGIAAAAGVGLASVVMKQLQGQLLIVGGRLPFWMALRLPADGVLYIAGLTLLAAAIIGVAPALKATGRQVHTGLQTLSPGSGSRMQMGRVWTTLIVAQVAFTVALMPLAIFLSWMALLQFRADDPGFASREFLTAQLVADRAAETPDDDGERAFTRQLAIAHGELDRRLREQSSVGEVTFSMAGVGEERALVLEVEGRDAPADPVNYNIVEGGKRGHFVRFNRVATNFFEAYEVPLIMGRTFIASDTQAVDTTAGVLVNRTLADLVFGGANPLGARIRYVGRSREANARDVTLNQWYEIVGVVPDFPTLASFETDRDSRVYHAATFGDVYPVELAVRVPSGDPMTFANALRDISAAVDPNLQLRDIATAEIVFQREQGLGRLIGLSVVAVLLSVMGLAAAGMYALMSFTVSQRRKEIGIRAALGANRNRLLIGIFARALGQLGAGAAAGLLGAIAVDRIIVDEGDRILEGQGAVIVPIVALAMILVGALAAFGPARRGLKIQPIEALREE